MQLYFFNNSNEYNCSFTKYMYIKWIKTNFKSLKLSVEIVVILYFLNNNSNKLLLKVI